MYGGMDQVYAGLKSLGLCEKLLFLISSSVLLQKRHLDASVANLLPKPSLTAHLYCMCKCLCKCVHYWQRVSE